MKNFLKMVLAVVCGLVIITIAGIMILGGFVNALSVGEKTTPSVAKSSALAIDMSKTLVSEQTIEFNPATFKSGATDIQTIGILEAVQAIDAAAFDPSIKFIYLKPDANMSGAATTEELRAALAKFRESGKPILAYTETPTTSSYYLASVADKVYMHGFEGATFMLNGVSSQMIFLKDLLDKLGVNVQLIRHGKYKSAGEMFVKNESSAENLHQNREMVNSIWKTFSKAICESRGICEEALNAAIDNLTLCEPQDMVDAGLADALLSKEELEKALATQCQVESFKNYAQIDLADYAKLRSKVNFKASKKLAVIYVDGEIVDGKEKQQVAGDRFASIISKVRSDSSVKAVVLRVNSPGGSVIASEKMKHELDLLKEQKPLVASFGNYAASGGYWISNNCDKIYSDATSITGSIGVFSMIPDFSKTAKDVLHVNITPVGTHKHSDMLSLMRKLDQDEYNYMLRSVENIYEKFTTIVAQGRGLDKGYVDEIGQGRVWTGAQGLDIKIVDEIGTLEDAIMFAAVSGGDSNLTNWNICQYPKPATAMEAIMEMFGERSMDEEARAIATVKNWYNDVQKGKASLFFARLPYEYQF